MKVLAFAKCAWDLFLINRLEKKNTKLLQELLLLTDRGVVAKPITLMDVDSQHIRSDGSVITIRKPRIPIPAAKYTIFYDSKDGRSIGSWTKYGDFMIMTFDENSKNKVRDILCILNRNCNILRDLS